MLAAQESAVLKAIFEAAGSQGGRWPDMLRALMEFLQASRSVLFMPTGVWDQDGPSSTPLPVSLTGLRLGRVYTGEELQDRDLQGELHASASDLRAIGLRAQDGHCWLLLSRSRGQFRAADSAALTAFAPHLVQAIDLAGRISVLASDMDRMTHLARRVGIGSMEFDGKGQCVALDQTARDLLLQVGRAPGDLAVRDLAIQPVSEHLEMICVPQADGGRRAYLRATNLPLPDATIIAKALGLTLSEARLARALGMGDTLSEAAQRLGLTLETARAYSKQIFAKTGLTGQPALMRRLWTSVLALA